MSRLTAVAPRLLGAIRLFNGAAALFAPRTMGRRLGADPDADPSAIYPLRMFGVRTIVLAAELLIGSEERRRQSLRTGVLIHASDTASAATAGFRRQLPLRVAVLATSVSAVNTALSVLGAREPRRSGLRGLAGRFSLRR